MERDWLAAAERLRQQGLHSPEGATLTADYHPPWWWGTTPVERASGRAEAIPLGDLADPVSQVAGLVAAPLLRGYRTLAEMVTTPVPGSTLRGLGQYPPAGPRGFLTGQRGNLGPPPVNDAGVPLPESVVRTETGDLQRLYHGTKRAYADFDMTRAGTGAGGDLYGPGIYMTENPAVASQYAKLNYDPQSIDGTIQELSRVAAKTTHRLNTLTNQPHSKQAQTIIDEYNRADRFSRAPFQKRDLSAETIKERLADDLQQYQQEIASLERIAPQIRPTYANLRRPFDADVGAVDPTEVATMAQKLQEAWGNTGNATADTLLQHARSRTHPIPYGELAGWVGKEEANRVLRRLGYDGITHIGGAGDQAHRVYIAFSPDDVYPSFNVDVLRPGYRPLADLTQGALP